MSAFFIILSLIALLSSALPARQPSPEQVDTAPPPEPVKLVFIHHSTGGNWLADPTGNDLGGGLGRALMENNYYVSATNYGWGPDSIGDSTDIPHWLDWLRGERSSVYLGALYNENGQNIGDFGVWPRLVADPGGENQVILFKSCFPNSDLEGSPTDPPAPEGWLSVSNAKYVYNEILKYFGTRPDKLFVVITAPPLIHSAYAANARAFNLWLVEDWLAENNYPLNNVAVFDYYNVLTGPDSQHRVVGGNVEHTYTPGGNLLYYPSGDDHPSRAGNAKATEEFMPLLNSFYHRWAATRTESPVESPVEIPEPEPEIEPEPVEVIPAEAEPVSIPAVQAGYLEDFDGGAQGWEVFADEVGGAGQVHAAIVSDRTYEGEYALRLQIQVGAGGWATYARFFEEPQDWRAYSGLGFALWSADPGTVIDVHVYAGSPHDRESYTFRTETSAMDDWTVVTIPWDDFRRVAWEDNPGAALTHTDQVLGVAFGFPGGDGGNRGELWLDSLQVWTEGAEYLPAIDPDAGAMPVEPAAEAAQEEQDGRGGFPFCGGAFALPLGLAACGLRRKKSQDRL